MKKYLKTQSLADPDMTPLLDVVFIMLIFFIVTATFVQEVGVSLNRTTEKSPPPPPDAPRTLQFQIGADNLFYESGHVIDIWAAEALIKRFHVENPKLPIILKPEHDATTGALLRIYEAGRNAGLPTHKIIVK